MIHTADAAKTTTYYDTIEDAPSLQIIRPRVLFDLCAPDAHDVCANERVGQQKQNVYLPA